MSLLHAVRRSYPYFVPDVLRSPRASIRRSFPYLFGLGLGFICGMYLSPSDRTRLPIWVFVIFGVLAVLKWWCWSDASQNEN